MKTISLPSNKQERLLQNIPGNYNLHTVTEDVLINDKKAYQKPIFRVQEQRYLSAAAVIPNAVPFSRPIQYASYNLNIPTKDLKFYPRSGALPIVRGAYGDDIKEGTQTAPSEGSLDDKVKQRPDENKNPLNRDDGETPIKEEPGGDKIKQEGDAKKQKQWAIDDAKRIIKEESEQRTASDQGQGFTKGGIAGGVIGAASATYNIASSAAIVGDATASGAEIGLVLGPEGAAAGAAIGFVVGCIGALVKGAVQGAVVGAGVGTVAGREVAETANSEEMKSFENMVKDGRPISDALRESRLDGKISDTHGSNTANAIMAVAGAAEVGVSGVSGGARTGEIGASNETVFEMPEEIQSQLNDVSEQFNIPSDELQQIIEHGKKAVQKHREVFSRRSRDISALESDEFGSPITSSKDKSLTFGKSSRFVKTANDVLNKTLNRANESMSSLGQKAKQTSNDIYSMISKGRTSENLLSGIGDTFTNTTSFEKDALGDFISKPIDMNDIGFEPADLQASSWLSSRARAVSEPSKMSYTYTEQRPVGNAVDMTGEMYQQAVQDNPNVSVRRINNQELAPKTGIRSTLGDEIQMEWDENWNNLSDITPNLQDTDIADILEPQRRELFDEQLTREEMEWLMGSNINEGTSMDTSLKWDKFIKADAKGNALAGDNALPKAKISRKATESISSLQTRPAKRPNMKATPDRVLTKSGGKKRITDELTSPDFESTGTSGTRDTSSSWDAFWQNKIPQNKSQLSNIIQRPVKPTKIPIPTKGTQTVITTPRSSRRTSQASILTDDMTTTPTLRRGSSSSIPLSVSRGSSINGVSQTSTARTQTSSTTANTSNKTQPLLRLSDDQERRRTSLAQSIPNTYKAEQNNIPTIVRAGRQWETLNKGKLRDVPLAQRPIQERDLRDLINSRQIARNRGEQLSPIVLQDGLLLRKEFQRLLQETQRSTLKPRTRRRG